jgi:hypothetical protein
MQAYVAGLKPSNTRYVLSPKSAFFRYFTLSGETSTPPSSAAH